MNERMRAAYKAYDTALKELAAAYEDEDGEADNDYEPFMVAHYITMIGLVRYNSDGGTEGAGLLLRPFGSQPDYITDGLLSGAVSIAEMNSAVYALPDED